MASLIGNGPSFPYNVSDSGGLSWVSDIDRINQSLFILFETPKGSRLNLPDFGSDLYKYKFDPLDTVLLERIRYTITQDITKWEPRISLTEISFLSDNSLVNNNTVYVYITYTIINTDVTGNYVYPYRLEPYSLAYDEE